MNFFIFAKNVVPLLLPSYEGNIPAIAIVIHKEPRMVYEGRGSFVRSP